MILLKNDEVLDCSTRPPTDFSALKMLKLKMLSNFQKQVTRWQRTAAFCQRESKSWLRVLR